MIESFATLAGRRPIAISVIAVVIAVLGFFSWKDLAIDLFPDIQSPTVLISIESADQPAEHMERLYGERVEQLLFTVPGLSSVEQTVRQGRLICRVHFNWDTDADLALVDVNRAVASIAADPLIDKVKVRRFDTKQLPVIVVGLNTVSNSHDLAELRTLAKRQLAPTLEQLNGVAEVRVSGGRVKQVQVQIDPTRLKAYGLTIKEVHNRISESNLDFNAGTLDEGDKVLLVRGKSRFISTQDIEQVVLSYRPNQANSITAIKVLDIAQVITVNEDITHLVRVNGKEGIGLFIYKEAGANSVEVSQQIRKSLISLTENLSTISATVISDQAALIENSISDLESAALFGISLAILVLIIFLRSAGPIVIVAIAVPISLLATTFAMSLAGHTLNLMTLGGLALGAGMLVDNAIVVVESIYRQRSIGESPTNAAIKGTSLVGGAIVTSTLTTCIVFLPVLFIEGMASKLVAGISFTVVISLLASLLVAIFVIPALSLSLLSKNTHQQFDPGSEGIEKLTLKILRKPGKVIILATVFVSIAIFCLTQLGTELVPPQDPRQFNLRVSTPAGQQLESTERNVANIESILQQAAGDKLQAILSEVGQLDDDDRIIREQHSAENTAQLMIRLGSGDLTATQLISVVNPVIKTLFATDVDWQIASTTVTQALGTSGPPIIIEVTGQSLSDLRYGVNKIQQNLKQLKEVWNVQNSFEGAADEIHLNVNQKLAERLSVDIEVLRSVIEAALDGHKVTTFNIGDETREVLIKLPNIDSETLLDLSFNTPNGEIITIGDVASIQVKPGAREIFRKNQQRIAQVTALVHGDYSEPRAKELVRQILLATELPAGISATLGGDEVTRQKTTSELSWAGGLALLLVLMVLAGSFESLLAPLVILSSIPIAIIGVAIALVPQAQPIGIMAMLGFVILVGVTVNDAILLVQTIDRKISKSASISQAIAKAVALRLRPILMTTATTVLSLLPLAIGAGEATQLRSPLAWTVIGGILLSTFGCLFVIPCCYLVSKRISPLKIRSVKQAKDAI